MAQNDEVGDGRAVFLGDMNDDDYEEYDRMENEGWKGFYKKIKQIGK